MQVVQLGHSPICTKVHEDRVHGRPLRTAGVAEGDPGTRKHEPPISRAQMVSTAPIPSVTLSCFARVPRPFSLMWTERKVPGCVHTSRHLSLGPHQRKWPRYPGKAAQSDTGDRGCAHHLSSADGGLMLPGAWVTFGDARCAKGSAMYSVLVHFRADGAVPELHYLHGRPPPGCVSTSELQDPMLYQDLCTHQQHHLCRGQDPHGKLCRLLLCPPLTGPAWFRPDMTAEQHMCRRSRLSFSARRSRPVTGRAGAG